MRRKEFSKRRYARIPLILPSDIRIGVDLYSLVANPAKRPAPVKLDSKSALPLISETRFIDTSTGDYVTPDKLAKCVSYGGEKVLMSDEEKGAFKATDEPSIRMLGELIPPQDSSTTLKHHCVQKGFKSRSSLKAWHNVRAPLFVHPNEMLFKGSSKLFSALLVSMVKQKVIMVATLVAKSNSSPKLVALLPQLEEKDEDDQVVLPAGFHAIVLPFRENIREFYLDATADDQEEVDESMIELAKKVIHTIHMNDQDDNVYNPLDFENPAIKKHYMSLEIIGLQESNHEGKSHTSPHASQSSSLSYAI